MRSKQEIRDEIRRRVSLALGPLLDAALALAQGYSTLVARQPDGRFERVTKLTARRLDPAMVYEVWLRSPSMPAIEDLLNRAADKPTEHHEHSGDEGRPIELAWVDPATHD